MHVKDGGRVIHGINNERPDDEFWIYEFAVPDGFRNGGFTDVDTIQIGGCELLRGRTSHAIDCEIPDELIEEGGMAIYSGSEDERKYIAYYKNNILTLFCYIKSITADGMKRILRLIDPPSPEPREIIVRKLLGFIRGGEVKTRKELEEKIERERDTQNSMFEEYRRSRERMESYLSQLHGIVTRENATREEVERQIERLYQSEDLEGVELSGNTITMITKPIKMGLWVIGQYAISYNLRRMGDTPRIVRINPPVALRDIYIQSLDGSGWFEPNYHHPHIHTVPCFGNAKDLVRAFWDGDLLTGFNLVVQYLKNYNGEGPYLKLEKYIKMMGYARDAEILHEHGGIHKIIDGRIYTYREGEVTLDTLREWGCTGRIDSEPELFYTDYDMLSSNGDNVDRTERGWFIIQSDGGIQCPICGDGIWDEEGEILEDEYVCTICFNEFAVRCERCDRWIHRDNSETVDGMVLCRECYRDTMWQEEEAEEE